MRSLLLLGLMGVAGAALSATAAERRLAVDPVQSRIEVSVKATVDSFVAKLAGYDADVRWDDAAGRVATAVLHGKFADVKTGKADRDAQMHEWQQTPKFPDVSFTLAKLMPVADGRFTATGRLTLHGVEKELNFPVAITADRTVVSVDGEAKLDTREFGLPVIRKFALLKVDPIVVVRFHLQGAMGVP